MKKIISMTIVAILLTMTFVSCGGNYLDGTYVPKNEAAKQVPFSKLVFQGNKVKCYMGMMGMPISASYEYGYKLTGNTVSFEASMPNGATISLDLTYDRIKQELSFSKGAFGEGMDKDIPVWGKEGAFDPNISE